jgi:hypothetical protein
MQKGLPKILSIAEIPSAQYPAVTKLPQWMIDGIGRVTVAQAFLEWRVNVLVFDLLMIDHPEGRVTLKDQSASERFKTVRSLLHLRGITPTVDVSALSKLIEECVTRRNQLAHGIWSGAARSAWRGSRALSLEDAFPGNGTTLRSFLRVACLVMASLLVVCECTDQAASRPIFGIGWIRS